MSDTLDLTVTIPRALVTTVQLVDAAQEHFDAASVSDVENMLAVAAGAVFDAILALPKEKVDKSAIIALAKTSKSSAHVLILPPAQVDPPTTTASHWYDFELRILKSGSSTMATVKVDETTTARELGRRLRQEEGFIVLSCKNERIFDERWEGEDDAASDRSMHELGITKHSIVHYQVAMNFK